MLQARKRTSMSVIEMGKRLGLGKTESYWLIKKNYFQTIVVGKKMRVMIASFEDWYANQCRYHKIDGTPPGAHIKEISMTADELGNLLGISEASAYELIAKGHFEKVDDLAKMRITKESFWKWYTAQTFYRTVEDQAEDKKLRQDAYTMPEIGKMLGLYRNQVYRFLHTNTTKETFPLPQFIANKKSAVIGSISDDGAPTLPKGENPAFSLCRNTLPPYMGNHTAPTQKSRHRRVLRPF